MPDDTKAQKGSTAHYVLRLFVAGEAPNSRIARDNLRRFQEQADDTVFDVEIVDVLEHPQVALESGVFVTPALQIVEPSPGRLVFGNLSNQEILSALFTEDLR